MTKEQITAQIFSSDEFMRKVANDIVRMAQSAEGLESWMQRHSCATHAPACITRKYANDLYGDSMDASLFNTCMILEIDRLKDSPKAA